MSDEQKSLNSSDESDKQDSSVDIDSTPDKGKRKGGRPRKSRIVPNKEQDQSSPVSPQLEEEQSSSDADDDLFADIRRSLAEEETAKREKKQKGIFQRVARFIKPAKDSSNEEALADEPESAVVVETVEKIDESIVVQASDEKNAIDVVADIRPGPEAMEEGKLILPAEQDVAEFILGLEPVEIIPEKPQDELPAKLEQDTSERADLVRGGEVLRKQPLPIKETVDQDFDAIREVALEDYSNEPIQSEDVPSITNRQKFKILMRGLKPIDKFLIFGAVSLMLLAATIGFGYSVISARVVEEVPVPTLDLPIPVRVTLPGGWEFNLTKGRVENEKWSPRGAEWLEGTELCKWVALPSSLQLEAVVRTLKSQDPIELTMSNADQLEYKVQSIQNVPVDEIDTLEVQTSCLLLILVNDDVDTRWVVTAIP